MANHCNSYFINVGLNMVKDIDVTPFRETIAINPNTMFLNPVTENELIEHISTLKNNCSPGIDGITVDLIKKTHRFILQPLKYIINLIFLKSVVPTQFKTSIVTPIYKAGDKTKICNYRPISVINNFGKIFEKCLKIRLVHFFDNNNIIHEHQFGFRAGKATSDAMCMVVKDVIEGLDTNKKCIAVFLDLAKAFDTVNHEILLNVLERYGIRGSVLDVFRSYLTSRVQSVKLNDIHSETGTVKIGVPQGTVLGPILFSAYINSLLSLKAHAKIVSYADDTVAIFCENSWPESKIAVQLGMETITNWLNMYHLSLNVSKTRYLAFTLTETNRPDFTSIKIAGMDDEIKETNEIKYLGLIIDKYLKWSNHIDYLTNKVRKLIYKFYQLREFLSKKLLLIIYKSLVESLIRYGIVVWGGMYRNSLQKINIAQNYILKIIFKKHRRYHTNLLYTEDICNVRSLYFHSLCIYAFKNKTFENYTSSVHHTRSTVNESLSTPRFRRNISHRFLTYTLPKVCNLLPIEIKHIKNLKKFATLSKKFIFQNYFNFINILDNYI